jgi:hypothetical protein
MWAGRTLRTVVACSKEEIRDSSVSVVTTQKNERPRNGVLFPVGSK